MQTASVQNQAREEGPTQASAAASPFARKGKRKAASGLFAALFSRLKEESGALSKNAGTGQDAASKAKNRQETSFEAARLETSRAKNGRGRDLGAGALAQGAERPFPRGGAGQGSEVAGVLLAGSQLAAKQAEAPALNKQAGDSDAAEKRAVQLREAQRKNRPGGPAASDEALLAAALARPENAQARPVAAKQIAGEGVDALEARKKPDRRREERKNAEIQVVDLRMRLEPEGRPEQGPSGSSSSAELAGLQGHGERSGNLGENAKNAKTEAAPAKSFAEVLASRLGNEGATDIVKAAQIVLKDGDTGLIRLKLDPESLGSVKIELRLAEKSIEGRIVVESEDAKAAFEKALGGLRDAFAREGFESARLEVSVGGQGNPSGSFPGGNDPETGKPFWSDRFRSYDEAVPLELPALARRGDGRVDILA